ncbi:hypothetical protein FERRO_11940 [Ferrovum sp. JA12]|nr:hypothetical protein FERRO_11940 [Ferrovum sp. JA12]
MLKAMGDSYGQHHADPGLPEGDDFRVNAEKAQGLLLVVEPVVESAPLAP